MCVFCDVTIVCCQSKMMGQMCWMTTVAKSSEMHQQPELMRQPTAHETVAEIVSYRCKHTSTLFRWGWRDTFSSDSTLWPNSCILSVSLCTDEKDTTQLTWLPGTMSSGVLWTYFVQILFSSSLWVLSFGLLDMRTKRWYDKFWIILDSIDRAMTAFLLRLLRVSRFLSTINDRKILVNAVASVPSGPPDLAFLLFARHIWGMCIFRRGPSQHDISTKPNLLWRSCRPRLWSMVVWTHARTRQITHPCSPNPAVTYPRRRANKVRFSYTNAQTVQVWLYTPSSVDRSLL